MHHGFLHRIGMEVELPLLPRDPEHYRTHVGEFWADLQRATGDGWTILRDPISGGIVGMSTGRSDTTVWSYDASILLLELSLPPKDSLEELRRHFDADLAHVLAVCSAHGLSVLGCGAQPELDVHAADAKKLWRTPKHMLYRIIDRHGWRHERNLVPAAIQPAVDVPVEKATEWVNFFEKLLPLLEPALANSCIERWEIDTQNAECRHWLSWSQMMQGSPDAPFAPIGMPVRPYRDLAEYLQYVYRSSSCPSATETTRRLLSSSPILSPARSAPLPSSSSLGRNGGVPPMTKEPIRSWRLLVCPSDSPRPWST
jgi:hypothetical protein